MARGAFGLGRLGFPLALLGLALAWTVMLLFGGLEFDRGLLVLFYAGNQPDLATAATWLTRLGDWNVVMVPVGFGAAWLIVRRRDYRTALLLFLVPLSGRLLVELQKDWTSRVRPDAQEHLVPAYSLAFPSGHAANATLAFVSLALLVPATPRARTLAIWAAVWLALLVGSTRIMLGVHWPSDVIGGWAFGLFWTLLLLRLSGAMLTEGTAPPLRHSSREGGRR